MPRQIRVSLGSAIVLGLLEGKLDAAPTTAYLMTYRAGKCTANCGFCPQARGSKNNAEMLSRVSWPVFPTKEALLALASAFEQHKIMRICIQALNYPEVFGHLEALAREIKGHSKVPVSVSSQPRTKTDMERLKAAGVDRLGIALDAATEEAFHRVKGSGAGGDYRWAELFCLLREALAVFGVGNVSTHVIVGLGETEQQAAEIIQQCVDLGVLPALFAFTPVRGTALEAKSPPQMAAYRRVQLARFLIVNGKTIVENLRFDSEGKIRGFGVAQDKLTEVIDGGLPFRTSGCPECNRPYYNERPGGPMYNYPRRLSKQEIEKVKKELFQ